MGRWSVRVPWRHGVVLVGCVAILLLPLSATSTAPPEVIYHNGVVLTMEDGLPRAEAVAVRDGRILAVGDDEDVLALRKRPTRVVDLGGRSMLPGFIDSHAHWIGDGNMVGYNADLAVDAALSRGWTSINEQFVDGGRLAELRALDAAGRLRLRVNAYLAVNFEDEKFGHWFRGYEPRHAYSPHLRLGGIKLFLDHDWGTTFHWDQAELDEYVLSAHRIGWQVTAHTISAEAHDQYLTAVARAQAAHPNPDARHRVEHVIQLRAINSPGWASQRRVRNLRGGREGQPGPRQVRGPRDPLGRSDDRRGGLVAGDPGARNHGRRTGGALRRHRTVLTWSALHSGNSASAPQSRPGLP